MIAKNDGIIKFTYGSNDTFNDVGLLSAYMTKNLMGEKGSMMDEFTISDDERQVYDVCVKQALPTIYEAMIKITSGVDEAFKATADSIEFNILDNEAYNSNVLTIVDETLHTCLKYAILAEFYSVCLNAELQRAALAKYADSLAQLKQRLFQLKKKAVAPLLYR